MKSIAHPGVARVFDHYPPKVRKRMLELRRLVLETAEETQGVEPLEETLKWGEPSYLTKGGSTVRMDWKAKNPDQYALYFKCTSKLVECFKAVFGDTFQYEGKRALVFDLKAPIPIAETKACIRAALRYHQVKQLPLLGLSSTQPGT